MKGRPRHFLFIFEDFSRPFHNSLLFLFPVVRGDGGGAPSAWLVIFFFGAKETGSFFAHFDGLFVIEVMESGFLKTGLVSVS